MVSLVLNTFYQLKNLFMAIQVGDKAPDFTLINTEKKPVSLSDYKGSNVVLLFFPLAFTGVCTTELFTMRDDIATYSGLNATVLGVSVANAQIRPC